MGIPPDLYLASALTIVGRHLKPFRRIESCASKWVSWIQMMSYLLMKFSKSGFWTEWPVMAVYVFLLAGKEFFQKVILMLTLIYAVLGHRFYILVLKKKHWFRLESTSGTLFRWEKWFLRQFSWNNSEQRNWAIYGLYAVKWKNQVWALKIRQIKILM